MLKRSRQGVSEEEREKYETGMRGETAGRKTAGKQMLIAGRNREEEQEIVGTGVERCFRLCCDWQTEVQLHCDG